ncbi:CDP-alcohol phosphatidyltransferase family protein [Rhodococcus xishaensis]|uniref:CDP-alcohol phosphatidyltransferase family protein n=1 Tax=Rhodococcus xishaensis TaxID=2487364 RepID=A0A3S3A4M9_9NOCA|nr:CDP-alcohol phosphatidyltransferase family protein [Rhodococcus xishaensis]RVW01936.1 CDP-alcohol phosphatidyltransferase family protein [Rhodococcus xishaensis]
MIDQYLRRKLDQPLARCAALIDIPAITPDRITGVGLVLGLGSAVSAGLQWWWVALVLWLLSRLADGLDGPLARRRRARTPTAGDAGAGGFFDITADFIVYGSTVVGVAVGATSAYGAPWWPFLLVLLAYYINGTVFLAFSSIAERSGRTLDDGRSLSFLGGLAEGAETVVVHALWLVFSAFAWQIAVVWAVVVAVSSVQRIIAGYRALR